jgi:hypothetical protein
VHQWRKKEQEIDRILAMNSNDSTPIPVGFRFHPTDEELVGYYLHGKVGRSQRDQLIQELDLYKIEPWDLHGKSASNAHLLQKSLAMI